MIQKASNVITGIFLSSYSPKPCFYSAISRWFTNEIESFFCQSFFLSLDTWTKSCKHFHVRSNHCSGILRDFRGHKETRLASTTKWRRRRYTGHCFHEQCSKKSRTNHFNSLGKLTERNNHEVFFPASLLRACTAWGYPTNVHVSKVSPSTRKSDFLIRGSTSLLQIWKYKAS